MHNFKNKYSLFKTCKEFLQLNKKTKKKIGKKFLIETLPKKTYKRQKACKKLLGNICL